LFGVSVDFWLELVSIVVMLEGGCMEGGLRG
jgi:hypothetical protein